jgi:hypothetical protein
MGITTVYGFVFDCNMVKNYAIFAFATGMEKC